MKIVAISDTHTYIPAVPIGDVLVHAGDFAGRGNLRDLEIFLAWFGALPHKHKILVAGNHDWCFLGRYERKEAVRRASEVCTYLEDSSITIDGIKFYGSPWQPEFHAWAFNLPRGKALKEKWDMIPEDTDVLITHGPPQFIRDFCPGGNVGCADLAARVMELNQLKYHIFGHIHEGYGIETRGNTTFINASICSGNYRPTNDPILVEI